MTGITLSLLGRRPLRHSRESTSSRKRGRESSFIALMQGAMGLGRKDGNTRSFHKNGWIPAFAGMTEWVSAGMTGWGVLATKRSASLPGAQTPCFFDCQDHRVVSAQPGLGPRLGDDLPGGVVGPDAFQFQAPAPGQGRFPQNWAFLWYDRQRLGAGSARIRMGNRERLPLFALSVA